jgi:Ser/Thr protein kinase RdoA (MazF antagonist)
MALTGRDATAIAERFSLGGSARLQGPVARGQVAQVWRLDSDSGSFAVKEWFAGPDPEDVAADAAFTDRLEAAGVPTPSVVRTRSGEVTCEVSGTLVRVFEWADLLPPTRRLDPDAVGRLVARLHLVGETNADPIDRWFSTGVGERRWTDLHARATAAGAPFAATLGDRLEDLIAVESVIEAHSDPIECHRDLWADNLLRTADGRLCVLDLENAGPADPSQELAMVLFEFGLDNAERVRRLHAAYVAAGGPGRVTRRGNFTMLVAVQAHIGQLVCARWIGSDDPTERAMREASVIELFDDPVTLARIDRILAALER